MYPDHFEAYQVATINISTKLSLNLGESNQEDYVAPIIQMRKSYFLENQYCLFPDSNSEDWKEMRNYLNQETNGNPPRGYTGIKLARYTPKKIFINIKKRKSQHSHILDKHSLKRVTCIEVVS